jgi:hypothetical protein
MFKGMIKFEDNLFQIKQVTQDTEPYSANIDLFCEWFKANKVLRKDNHLYFLEKIEDAEVIAWLPKQ